MSRFPPLRSAALAAPALAALLVTCQRSTSCTLQLSDVAPANAGMTVQVGREVPFTASVRACSASSGAQYHWSLNGQEVSQAPDYAFFACPSKKGPNTVSLEVVDASGESTTRTWSVSVDTSNPPPTPACVSQAVWDIKQGGRLGFGDDLSRSTEARYQTDLQCLESYLATNACDRDASYAAGLARLVLFASGFQALWEARTAVTTDSLLALLQDQLAPTLDHYLAAQSEMEDRCAQRIGPDHAQCLDQMNFHVEELDVRVFNDDPTTPNVNEQITLKFGGRHDMGEVYLLTSGAMLAQGFLDIALAYNGTIETLANLPLNFGASVVDNYYAIMKSALTRLVANPQLLRLRGDEGKALLLRAQSLLAAGLRSYSVGIGEILHEPHAQVDDIFRWFDCGKDGICPSSCAYGFNVTGCAGVLVPDLSFCPAPHCANDPNWDVNGDHCRSEGDPAEPCDAPLANGKCPGGVAYYDVNGNGRWNDSWAHVGPDGDGTECDCRYESGEPVGTEFVAELGRVRLVVSQTILDDIERLAQNIEGPDAANLDQLLGLSTGTVRSLLALYDVPYPTLRISRFFATAPDLRDLLPLYDRRTLQFFNDLEEEPFRDVGFDQEANADESGRGCDDHRPPGYDPQLNPDPNCDDFNPQTNNTDCKDNNDNGKTDWHDIHCLPGTTTCFALDLGVENNLLFDFHDTNQNRQHDPGEISEPFSDTGVVDWRGQNYGGAGNGRHDEIDYAHVWPSGPNVGGPPVGVVRDPRTQTTKDKTLQCLDGTPCPDGSINPVYFFFPDPTFGGILGFTDPQTGGPIVNADGETLNRNAAAARFVAKAYYFAVKFLQLFQ